MIQFEWDEPKVRSNQERHGATFVEAQSVFYDDFALQFFDEENSSEEDRFILLGMSNRSRLLIVVHCERSGGELIRII